MINQIQAFSWKTIAYLYFVDHIDLKDHLEVNLPLK